MTSTQSIAGFSTVELLISMFIAVAFIGSGYQLYSVVIKDGAEARDRGKASNTAYTYLRKAAAQISQPCVGDSDTDNLPANSGLKNATVSTVVSCPYGSADNTSKISVTVRYGTPQQEVVHALFATK